MRMSDYNGWTLNSSGDSKIELNPIGIPESKAILEWYNGLKSKHDLTSISTSK